MMFIKLCFILTGLVFGDTQQFDSNRNTEINPRGSQRDKLLQEELIIHPEINNLQYESDSEVLDKIPNVFSQYKVNVSDETLAQWKQTINKTCGNDDKCREEKLFREIQIRKFESIILKTLNWTALPTSPFGNMGGHPSTNIPVHERLGKHHKNQEGARKKEKEFEESTYSMKIPNKPMPYNDHADLAEERLYFGFSEGQRRDQVLKSAKLWYYVKPYNFSEWAFVVIDEYRQTNNSDGNLVFVPTFHKEKEKNFFRRRSHGFWKHVKLTTLAKKWFEDTNLNHGIRIYVRGHSNAIVNGTQESNGNLQTPYLNVTFSKARHSQKQNAIRCNTTSHGNSCCLYDLQLNFEKLGYDWVVAPTILQTNMCYGNCSTLDTFNMRNDAIGYIRRPEVTSCCVPISFTDVSISLYNENQNITSKNISDLQIEKCGYA